jgi:hypothetical protein
MKKSTFFQTQSWIFVPTLLLCFFMLSYCTHTQQQQTDNSVEEFKEYVNTKVNKVEDETEENWEAIEREYNEKKAKADAKAAKLEAEAKQSYDKAVSDWDTYKSKSIEKQLLKQAEKEARLLRSSLVPAGIDVDLSNVNGNNIVSVYEHFIDVIENNKETYSKEQWINVNNYWKSLNDVRDRLDKNNAISKGDNKVINGLKTKYGAIKVLNKPFAQSENK